MNPSDLVSFPSKPIPLDPAAPAREAQEVSGSGAFLQDGRCWFNVLRAHVAGWSKQSGFRRLHAGLALSWFAHDLIRGVSGEGRAALASLVQMAIHPAVFLWGFFALAPAVWSASPWTGAKRMLECLVCAAVFFALLWGLEGALGLAAQGRFLPLRTLYRDLLVSVPAMAASGAALARLGSFRSGQGPIMERPPQDQGHALLNQLHPHLLCNALNGLAELSKTHPERVEDSILDLSDFLRKVSEACLHPTHTLEEESELLEAYLDLGCPNLGHGLRVEWDWDESLNGCRIPTLLLQPLLENAVKHGGARPGGSIRLRAQRAEEGAEEGLVLEVRNRGRLKTGGAVTGIGLRNLAGRLQAAYQGRASFSLQAEGGWIVARVRIPLAGLEQIHAA